MKSKKRVRERNWDLRERRALCPNATVLAENGCRAELIAFDFAQEVLVNVGLPRHFLKLVLAALKLEFLGVCVCLLRKSDWWELTSALCSSSVETTVISYKWWGLHVYLPECPSITPKYSLAVKKETWHHFFLLSFTVTFYLYIFSLI